MFKKKGDTMKKRMSIALLFFSFVLCVADNSRKISQEIEQNIIEMEKWIYTLLPDELSDFLGQSFSPPQTIDADTLKQRINKEKDLVVINVLSDRVFTDCHIKGSINVPLHEMIQRTRDWDRNKKIVVYCALEECDASEKAYILLSALDFTNVIEYPGGILEWFNLGYPVTGPCVLSYLHQETKALQMCHPSTITQ
jgi:rhodanese-related sulfurtransferase